MNGVPVVVALGSNVGESLQLLQRAVGALRKIIRVDQVSSVYRTAPMYVEDQPPFLNAALVGSTCLGPRGLLKELKRIEGEVGRQAGDRYGPREIDLDLIGYGVLSYTFSGNDKTLILPHPKTAERRFVLAPLCEIAPDIRLTGLGIVSDLIDHTNDQAGDVERLDNAQL